jgi:predicted RNase H-like HicB family nuclease
MTTMTTTPETRYSLVIEWSDEDQAYIATIPEFSIKTHGDTYEEAFRLGRELMDEVVAAYQQLGRALPSPRTHVANAS